MVREVPLPIPWVVALLLSSLGRGRFEPSLASAGLGRRNGVSQSPCDTECGLPEGDYRTLAGSTESDSAARRRGLAPGRRMGSGRRRQTERREQIFTGYCQERASGVRSREAWKIGGRFTRIRVGAMSVWLISRRCGLENVEDVANLYHDGELPYIMMSLLLKA